MFTPRPVSIGTLLLALTAVALAGCSTPSPSGTAPETSAECAVVDNDFDFDDVMAVPAMMGTENVVAIVQTEGVSRAPESTAAAQVLVSQESAAHRPPVIEGASPSVSPDLSDEAWLPPIRAIMEKLNGFMAEPLDPAASAQTFTEAIVDATADCSTIDVVVTGPFTSFVTYSPAISEKIHRVVMQGVPLRGDPTQEPGNLSFNCKYDLTACEKAFAQLADYDAIWVDIPRNTDAVYSPTAAMVEGLRDEGLPGILKAALLETPETWLPERLPPGGKSKLWDHSAALYLAHPEVFTEVGKHLVTTLTPEEFQKQWTSDVNKNVTKQ
jgi:inosine-uridine nucleoside N-ribohydrolase